MSAVCVRGWRVSSLSELGKRAWLGLASCLLLLTLSSGCGNDREASTPPADTSDAPAVPASEVPPAATGAAGVAAQLNTLIGELPEEAVSERNPVSEAKISLGRWLYYDARLSKNHDISCNSCHQLARYGVDGEPTSPGHQGQRGDRNSPTVYNAALHIAQFWDGRAEDVEAQAKGRILNPVEMAMPSEEAVLAVLNSIPEYPPLFAEAFPGDKDPVSYDNLADAIGAFERRLMTPARVDAFAAGDTSALQEDQIRGAALFLEVGCTTCHVGAALGGRMYQKLGLVHPYETEDVGRMAVTGLEADKHIFKVPSLRNVAETGPWFHDGSISELGDAVRKMAWHQLGKELDDGQVADLVAFLNALTGTLPEAYIAEPELPESGPDTPAPDPT